MTKFKKKLIILLLLLPCLSGCWDNKDINHRIMPLVLGVSREGQELKVILQIPKPAKDVTETSLVIGRGETVNQAVENISQNMESEIDLLHVKVILVEKQLAEEGLKDLIGGFIRSRDISPKSIIAITETKIEDIFEKVKDDNTTEGSLLLDHFEKNSGWNPQIALTRIWEVYRSIHSYTRDVAIPLIKVGKSTFIEQIGSAVIKNGKMVGKISPEQTLIFNVIKGESARGKIEVFNEGSVLILQSHTKHKSQFSNGVPSLRYTINLDVMILETKNNPTTKDIEKGVEILVTNGFDTMFKKLKNERADIIGFGQYFRYHIPREELKQWRSKYFTDLQVSFNVKVNISNKGYLKFPSN
ncbi:Ger(x)C family spore germination protein [Fictibacillus sp. 23RED33]|uniref:Ger(x)C family spore germination protein n=1 Tax=Fictibacillus sp. 23RED33 TaxID=2745879 RepID=UPI0018CD47D5|nr:Ger(x)C family spore germination protein [Fictibacillus sp. 23RED33]MBH0175734.1 Ger(x)C family spore germination protein [Fictibacillus sp. 23RED33]